MDNIQNIPSAPVQSAPVMESPRNGGSKIGMIIGALVIAYLQSEVVQIFYDYIRFMDLFIFVSVYFMIKALEDIDLPEGANIGAIVREGKNGSEVVIAHDNVVVQSGDHVIVFLLQKRHIRDIEKLFQVGFSFF